MTRALRRLLCAAPILILAIVSLGLTGVSGATTAPPTSHLSAVVLTNIGPGYAVTSQGPLNADQFASSSPDPTAAAHALAALGHTISTYQRVWGQPTGKNEVQDLVVRFAAPVDAQSFLTAVRHGLTSGEVVGSKPVPGIPGALRTTYFATTSQVGVGEAITLRSGRYVALLSFFSAGQDNSQPITEADAGTVATAQYAALARLSGVHVAAPKPASSSSSGWRVAIATVLIIVVVLLFLRLRRTFTSHLSVVEGSPDTN